jgi:hypothetical protein
MFLQMKGQLIVDNVGDYPAGIVDQLRKLLSSGVVACPDPNRMNFYDVENSDWTFFIHLSSRSGGKVMLLAAWSCVLPSTESALSPEAAQPR